MRAGRLNRDVGLAQTIFSTMGAERFQQLAMHVDKAAASTPLMQVVNILGHDQKVVAERRLQSGDCAMGRIGLHVREAVSA